MPGPSQAVKESLLNERGKDVKRTLHAVFAALLQLLS